MMRISRQIIFSTLVFVAVMGIFLLAQKLIFKPVQNESAATYSSAENDSKVLSGYNLNDVKRIAIQTKKGSGFQFSVDDNSDWSMNPPFEALVMDQTQVNRFVAELFALEYKEQLDADYSVELLGLRETADLIILSFDGDSPQDILVKIGSETDTKDSYYVQVGEQVPVVVDKAQINSLNMFMALDVLTLQEK